MATTLDARQAGWLNRRRGNLLGVFWCAALMAYALFVQYQMNEEPCPLCVFQRIAVVATGLVFLAAAIHDPDRIAGRVYATLILLTTLAGILIAARHIWIISQPAGTVAACGASLDYMLDMLPLREVLAKVLSGSGECANVTWSFLGLDTPTWVLINLAALAALGVLANVVLRKDSVPSAGAA